MRFSCSNSALKKPKNYLFDLFVSISGIIKQFNVLDDLQNDAGEEKSSTNVILAVPNSSEEQVVLRDVETLNFITQFEICRIIFFARGNSGKHQDILSYEKF